VRALPSVRSHADRRFRRFGARCCSCFAQIGERIKNFAVRKRGCYVHYYCSDYRRRVGSYYPDCFDPAAPHAGQIGRVLRVGQWRCGTARGPLVSPFILLAGNIAVLAMVVSVSNPGSGKGEVCFMCFRTDATISSAPRRAGLVPGMAITGKGLEEMHLRQGTEFMVGTLS